MESLLSGAVVWDNSGSVRQKLLNWSALWSKQQPFLEYFIQFDLISTFIQAGNYNNSNISFIHLFNPDSLNSIYSDSKMHFWILLGHLMKLFKSLGVSLPSKHPISLWQYIAFILLFCHLESTAYPYSILFEQSKDNLDQLG